MFNLLQNNPELQRFLLIPEEIKNDLAVITKICPNSQRFLKVAQKPAMSEFKILSARPKKRGLISDFPPDLGNTAVEVFKGSKHDSDFFKSVK